MKSIHHGKAGANSKLKGKGKGKLSKSLSCGCCGCCGLQNWKWRERLKEVDKEIKERGLDGKAAVC